MLISEGSMAIWKVIQVALEDNDGALIGRNGSTELELMIDINKEYLYPALKHNAGIYPISTEAHLIKWQKASIDATRLSDVLVTGWYKPLVESEQFALHLWKFQGIQIPLRSLEPYYVPLEEQWTQLLSRESVSVVSSFTETMKSQVKKLDLIWPKGVLPRDIYWRWVQTGYAPDVAKGQNEWPYTVKSWSDAVDYVVSEVVSQGSRFALIGCGALGMPIAKALKERGVICIVMGGAIQILFGIKGKRWEKHEVISKSWNEHWVWPSKEETPTNSNAIEGGCYWSR